MSNRPVLEREDTVNQAVTEHELTIALAYAVLDRPARKRQKKDLKQPQPYVGQKLDKDLLRVLVNTAFRRWGEERKMFLPLLVANVVRDATPSYKGTEAETNLRYQAYKCAVMKIMSTRRVWQMKNDKKKRARGLEIPKRDHQTEHPQDEAARLKGQLRLFS